MIEIFWDTTEICFQLYWDAAPRTCEAFVKSLPFNKTLYHARQSGEEIWTSEAPLLDIIQENASVFTNPGEIVIGPKSAERTKTKGCLGIYYGNGQGIDCCNIFGKVYPEDLHLLKSLGEEIWKSGARELKFEMIE